MTLLPDADLSKKMEAEEKDKIEQFRKSLTKEQVGRESKRLIIKSACG